MSKKHLMIAINWFGPYRQDLEAIRKIAERDYEHGLYLAIGLTSYQRYEKTLQYIGIGIPISRRLTDRHHRLPLNKRQREIWLRDIATAEPSGKNLKVTPATLDYAEWLHARFLRLPLNDKKTKWLPPRSITILNRWFHTDCERLHGKRTHPDWPDLIDYPADDLPARAVWFGSPGRQRRFLAPDYAKPD